MAYNNGFPIGYQPFPQFALPVQQPIQQPIQQPAQQSMPQQSNDGIVWVQGEAGAKAHLVAAGNTVMMLDSDEPVFYIKSTAPDGKPLPLKIFDYKERTVEKADGKYVTYDELERRLDAFRKEREEYGKSFEQPYEGQSAEHGADVQPIQG